LRALPTRGLLYAAVLILLVLTVAVVALWMRLTDAEAIRTALGARLEEALGERVELGEVELVRLPLPAASIHDVRIGSLPNLLLEAPEIRVGLSLFGLLTGDVVVRSLTLESPRIRLPENAPGAASADAGSGSSRWRRAGEPSRVQLAIDRLILRDGSLAAGGVQLEHVELRGALGVDKAPAFEFTAESAGFMRLEQGRLELSALDAPLADWRWSATGQLARFDLGELGKRLERADVRGTAEGRFQATGRGLIAQTETLELTSTDLTIAGDGVQVRGIAKLEGEFPSRSVRVALRDAQITYGEQLEKPAGVAFSLVGVLAESALPLRLRDLQIESDGLRANGELDLSPRPSLSLRAGSVDLAALSMWRVPDWMPRSGRARIESAELRLAPAEVDAVGALDDVVVPLPGGTSAIVSGHAWARGTLVGGEALQVEIAGQTLEGSARYDWKREQIELTAAARGVDAAPLSQALLHRTDISGRLYGRVSVTGPLDGYAMKGIGEFELERGRFPSISLARSAGLEESVEDPSQLDHFEKLGATFEIAGDHLEVSELTIEQDYAVAALHGQIYLRSSTADLMGDVILSFPELPEPSLREIPRAGGSLTDIEIHISQAESEDDKQMETAMIKVIRRVEKERREGRAAP
jgi:hypothetical protein